MIPFIDLKAQFARIEADVRRRMDAVLSHGQFVMGPEVFELEKRLAEFTGAAKVLSCSSGTDALLIPLMALGVGPGDAVFVPSFTFVATAEAVSLTGATPVFVDIDPVTFSMDPADLERRIEDLRDGRHGPGLPESLAGLTPRGIIAVDLFGIPCDYPAIQNIGYRHGLFVIGDAAQSFGASLQGRKSCALARISCTSFFPAKPLGGYGDGGAVFLRDAVDEELYDLMTSIRVHGMGTGGQDKYTNVRVGLNARLDTLQAAILLAKMEIFPEEIDMRQTVAAGYAAAIDPDRFTAPRVPAGSVSAWAQYSVLARDAQSRAAAQERLKAAGIPTAVYYPKPLHLQQVYASLGYAPGSLPVTEDCSRRIFSLPMHPYLAESDVRRIAEVLNADVLNAD